MPDPADLERLPNRLDDPALLRAVVDMMLAQALDRAAIERLLINLRPVDLDLLSDCFQANPQHRQAA